MRLFEFFLAALVLVASARDAQAGSTRAESPAGVTALVAEAPGAGAQWAARLVPIEVACFGTRASAPVRLYRPDGNIDEQARTIFERVASSDADAHPLAIRLEQLVMKAAYHFRGARVIVISAFRPRAGRHGTGEALDFKLQGVRAGQLAAYLRHLPRTGVGIYTHPRTQFVHLDVRESSYFWIDASPPGVRWRPAQLRDPSAAKRDMSWTSEMDLPI